MALDIEATYAELMAIVATLNAGNSEASSECVPLEAWGDEVDALWRMEELFECLDDGLRMGSPLPKAWNFHDDTA